MYVDNQHSYAGDDATMAGKQHQEKSFDRLLLSLYTEAIPVSSRHEALSHRREGISYKDESDDDNHWTENDTLQTLDGCSYDEYLGLRWYHEDPLHLIRRACESKHNGTLFRDDEFPVHSNVQTSITLINNDEEEEEVIKCIPGVITPSNCKDFRHSGIPKRIKRIQHFTDRAKLSGGAWKWVRGSAMEGGCTLFSSSMQSIDPRNVIQGKVGNCGFCSGFASIAAVCPSLISDAFGFGEESSCASISTCGAVSILLYPQGKPRYLLIDDFVLCQDDTTISEDSGRRTKSPSMHSLLERDLWVRLLEKAFVKIQGSYASLDGYYKFESLYRHPARAMQLLTGAPLALELHYSTMDEDTMYNILAGMTQGSFARVVHCRKRIHNLIPNHGYSLLWAGEGSDGTKLACLRNPHGRGSYEGMFGLGHTEELRQTLFGEDNDTNDNVPTCFTVCKKTGRVVWNQQDDAIESNPAYCLTSINDDNGIFCLSFKTFIECFPITTICGPICQGTADAVIDVPECVHKVERENLSCVYELIDSAIRLL